MEISGVSKRFYWLRYLLIIMLVLLAVSLPASPVAAAPGVTLTPNTGAVGTDITINGTLFDSYIGDTIRLYFDGNEIPDSPYILESATFVISFVIPADATPGQHWIRVKTDDGVLELAKNFFIVDQTAIGLDIAEGPVGTAVIITGIGFYAGKTVNLYYYNIVGDSIGTEIASATGTFNHSFIIPASAGGVHRILAINIDGNSAETAFTVVPTVILSSNSAGPGDLLFVSGTGFGYQANVVITLGTSTVATARTDDYGNFDVGFNIPDLKPNPYDIRIEDSKGNSYRQSYIVTAGANISSSTGAIGDTVAVNGTGFTAGQEVTIYFDETIVATPRADTNGTFETSFDVPPGTGGSHIITVTDGITTKQFTYSIETEPPPVPTLILPDDGDETKADAFFDWQDVDDASLPVSYRLQISSGGSFASPVIDRPNLAESEYNLTRPEALAADASRTPYYWRVMAIDSALNASDWSSPRSFYVNVPSTPSLLLPVSDSQSDIPVQFSWQSVTSFSPPVTYSLEISRDLNFLATVLQVSGLTAPEFNLTESDEVKLERGEVYYWRVKATDDIGNESAWSTPAVFLVNPSFAFPAWALYTLIGIGVIIIGFIAFRVGRKTAYSTPE